MAYGSIRWMVAEYVHCDVIITASMATERWTITRCVEPGLTNQVCRSHVPVVVAALLEIEFPFARRSDGASTPVSTHT